MPGILEDEKENLDQSVSDDSHSLDKLSPPDK
jgi:hypothetical protein